MSPALWLERGRAEDVPQLAALEAESFSHPWTEEQIRQEIAAPPPGAVLVLRAVVPSVSGATTTMLVAYCAYRIVVDEMHVMDVAVAPRWLRRGLARWLLRFCLTRAARDGAVRAVLEVRSGNAAARKLYAGLGFSEIGRRRDYYAAPVEDAVVLSLDPLSAALP